MSIALAGMVEAAPDPGARGTTRAVAASRAADAPARDLQRPGDGREGARIQVGIPMVGHMQTLIRRCLPALLLGLATSLAGCAVPRSGPADGPAYVLGGAPTAETTPMRRCDPAVLAMLEEAEIPAPAAGWSGEAQAVTVFNVFAGEVMIGLGDRVVCGRMHDARSRDSRFRAGVGLVVVPDQGSREPIRVGWRAPIKAHWIPSIRLGAPSTIQQEDTLRLVTRTSCLAIALALAFSALMGFVGARDRTFLGHAGMCVTLLLWQATLGGLSGFPQPWLPVGDQESRWQVVFTGFSFGFMLYGISGLTGVAGHRPRLRRLAHRAIWLLFGLGVLGALVPASALPAVWWIADRAFLIAALGLTCVACLSIHRGDRRATAVLAAALPFTLLAVPLVASSPLVVAYRIEIIQLLLTWFLVVMAYTLTNRYGQLRAQRDAMRQLADTDPLTGLPNRRAGLARLEEAFAQARHTGTPLSIGFVDVDLFKRINDLHGHEVGDRVLVAVADALVAATRRTDDVVRMGGEEFLVLLPGLAGPAAHVRLENIRQRIGELAPMLDVAGLQFTASIGLASLAGSDESPAALLRRADDAMYRAKHAGRDQVVGDEDPSPATPA